MTRNSSKSSQDYDKKTNEDDSGFSQDGTHHSFFLYDRYNIGDMVYSNHLKKGNDVWKIRTQIRINFSEA